ncbi:MAG: gluconate 2-dehydrogenase subunit 3 family protein [Polyangiaceae bacterium]
MATEPRKVSRRKLLFFGGAVTVAGALAVVRTTGYASLPGGPAAPLVLSKGAWHTVVALSRRIAASDGGPDVPSPDDVGVVSFIDGYVASMDAPIRKDLLQFLDYIEQLAPIGCGLFSRFSKLSAADQDRVLSSLEASSSDLLRGGFQGVKALVFMGYYRDPRTWSILGYDGPQVGRR